MRAFEIIEDAAGVGIVTKQNATADVPVGGEYMNVGKLFPKKKKKKTKEDVDLDESITRVTLASGEKKHLRTYGKITNQSIIDYYRKMGERVVCIDDDCDLDENFADGKVKGKSRPGRVKKAGASCKGSVTDLRAKAKKYGGEKGKMYHWCANMKGGKK